MHTQINETTEMVLAQMFNVDLPTELLGLSGTDSIPWCEIRSKR
jgi:hypothetical protein